MKKIIFVLIFVFCASVLFAKKVTVSLDIRWKEKEMYIFGLNEKMQIPFLTITYQNHSKDSIYFFNHYGTNEDYLSYLFPILTTYGSAVSEKLEKCLSDSVDIGRICIDIGENIDFKIILNDFNQGGNNFAGNVNTTSFEFGYDMPLKNDSLLELISECYLDIKELLILQDSLNNKDKNLQIFPFNYPNKEYISKTDAFYVGNDIEPNEFFIDSLLKRLDLQDDSLKNEQYRKQIWQRNYHYYEESIRRNYTYLHPFEKKEIEFDLTILYLLKGRYTIMYPDHVPLNQLYFLDSTLPLDKIVTVKKRTKKVVNTKEAMIYYKLPKQYKGYKLYHKKIKGAKVKLFF